MTLVAKRTIYKGFKFASRLEARWCHFMDELGISWDYEPDPYDLDGLTYIPDLRLNSMRMWHEVKGEIRSDEAGLKIIEKCKRLAVLSAMPVMLTFHDPLDMRCALFGVLGNMYTDAHYQHCAQCGNLSVMARVDGVARTLCPNKVKHTGALPIEEQRRLSRLLFSAATAARQRRFGQE